MSLFDNITNQLSGIGGLDQATLLQHAAQLVEGQGGMQGLLDQFHAAGLSEHVQSWLGSGANLPITAEQLESALGSGPIASIAEKLGLPADQISAKLAEILPGLVDHASPDGQPASMGDLSQNLGALASKLFG